MSAEGTRRAIVAALLANLGIAAAKFLAFAVTGSAGMLAEAVHSVADTGNQGLLVLGGRRSRRAATLEHPFGFGAERYFWAFVVAVVLFTLGAAFAISEGISKLVHPHELDSPVWAIAVLGFGFVLESLSFRTAVREARRSWPHGSLTSFVRASKDPEIPVVLLEDSAALVGLVLAFAGVVLAELTGEPAFDAAGSVAIGLVLGVVAYVLAREMKSLLIGEGASPTTIERIRSAVCTGPEVGRIIHERTLYLGPDHLLVAVKVEMNVATIPDLAAAIDVVEARIRAAVPIAQTIYVEPDVYRPR